MAGDHQFMAEVKPCPPGQCHCGANAQPTDRPWKTLGSPPPSRHALTSLSLARSLSLRVLCSADFTWALKRPPCPCPCPWSRMERPGGADRSHCLDWPIHQAGSLSALASCISRSSPGQRKKGPGTDRGVPQYRQLLIYSPHHRFAWFALPETQRFLSPWSAVGHFVGWKMSGVFVGVRRAFPETNGWKWGSQRLRCSFSGICNTQRNQGWWHF